MKKLILLLCVFNIAFSATTQKNLKKYEKGYRYEKEGWIYVHIEGAPYERGFQYGFLVADEYKKAMKVYQDMTYQTTGMDYSFFVNQAALMQKNKIPKELLDEMQGMADGLTKAGVKASVDDLIGWNAYPEMVSNWWPKAMDKFAPLAPKGNTPKISKCSAFIATGKATKDGKIVIAHTTFDNFWNAQFDNIILDLLPENGFRIMMQSQPLFLSSMEDFFVLSSGIVGVETTIGNFNGYDENKTPEYVRARMAMQYGKSIDHFIELLNKENNGGVAATWLIGDTNTNEIAEFEQGLLFQKVNKKKNGYFFGNNLANDPKIRNLECSDEGYSDIRLSGARRVRWMELLEKNYGLIDAEVAKQMISDHFDVYTKKEKASTRTICAHGDEDPGLLSKAVPFNPKGSLDAKVTTSDMAKKMTFLARYGRACGSSFDSSSFLKEHMQWDWQKKALESRPSRPWVTFSNE